MAAPADYRGPQLLAQTQIIQRGDSHYGTLEVLRLCRARGPDYTLGAAPTSALRKHILSLEESTAARAAATTDGRKLRWFKEFDLAPEMPLF